ncbi:uncharacterized protein LOC115980710 [Quercus lobata]|uniref:uncharacterized protein LOC115980710 n=1 Tax=Quercus lobata TaxID=97700 RepID=UPI00124906C8|nr:uncharacterized protein LOC115980710 [Quercus lobata]
MADGEQNSQPRTLKDYVQPIVNDNYSGVRRQTINANNFELKPALISMVQQAQFSRSPLDDPNIHLAIFLEICDTVKMNGVTEDTIRLRLFPFSLRTRLEVGYNLYNWEASLVGRKWQKSFLLNSFHLQKQPNSGIFYNGLNGQTRTIVDSASGGTLMSKTAEGATSLLEKMASNNYQWLTKRTMAKKVAGIHELDLFAALSAQVVSLSHQVSTLTTQRIPQSAEYVATSSMTVPMNEVSQEQVQYINNRNYNYRGNPMPNYYHLGLRNHENFSYGNMKNVLQPPPEFNSQPSEKKMPLEDAMISFVEETKARFKKFDSRLDNIETHCSNMGATMKNLEVQIGQLATTINAQQRETFPSNTEVNPKEQCKAITLRSRREIERSPSKETESTPTTPNNGQSKNKVEEEEIVNDTLRETDMPPSISFPDNPPILSTPFPYPQHALEQMPNYAKFLKDIISKKRRLEEFETVKLSEECSVILQKKLPQKLKDPGSFTLSCTIGDSFFDKVLCDLGASINLMPLSVYRKLGL